MTIQKKIMISNIVGTMITALMICLICVAYQFLPDHLNMYRGCIGCLFPVYLKNGSWKAAETEKGRCYGGGRQSGLSDHLYRTR